MEDNAKATCTFVAEDVQAIFAVSKEKAEEWLALNRGHIEERMFVSGHHIIEALGAFDGLPLNRKTFEE